MNGYLVLLGCAMDDLPLRFFARKREAMEYIESITEGCKVEYLSELPKSVLKAEDVYDSDISSPVCLEIIKFRDGRPVGKRECFEDLW